MYPRYYQILPTQNADIKITPSSNFQAQKKGKAQTQKIPKSKSPQPTNITGPTYNMTSKQLLAQEISMRNSQSAGDIDQRIQKRNVGGFELKGKIYSASTRQNVEILESKISTIMQQQGVSQIKGLEIPNLKQNQQTSLQTSMDYNERQKVANFRALSQKGSPQKQIQQSSSRNSNLQNELNQNMLEKENNQSYSNQYSKSASSMVRKKVGKFTTQYQQTVLDTEQFKKKMSIYTKQYEPVKDLSEHFFIDLVESQRELREKFKRNVAYLEDMKPAANAVTKVEILEKFLLQNNWFTSDNAKKEVMELVMEIEKLIIQGFRKLQKRQTIYVEKENEVDQDLLRDYKSMKQEKERTQALKKEIDQELRDLKRMHAQSENKWNEEKAQLVTRMEMLTSQCEELQKLNEIEEVQNIMKKQQTSYENQIKTQQKRIEKMEATIYKLQHKLGLKKEKYATKKNTYKNQQENTDNLNKRIEELRISLEETQEEYNKF